jgi:hypothetical protein
MDPKEIAGLLSVLESRRVAVSVVGAVAFVGVGGAVTFDSLLTAAQRAPALASPAVVTVALVAALAAGYSLTLLTLGGLQALINAILRLREEQVARGRELDQAREDDARREQAARARDEALRLALPHLPAASHDLLRQLLHAGTDGVLLHRDATTLGSLTQLGVVASRVAVDGKRDVFSITAGARQRVATFLQTQREEQITRAITRLTPAGRSLLALFALPEPGPGDPAHEWIENNVYNAAHDLEHAKILVRERDLASGLAAKVPGIPLKRGDERLLLAEDAVPFVRQLVLKEPVQRTCVALDHSLIAGTHASGSGENGGRALPLSAGIPWPVQYSGRQV